MTPYTLPVALLFCALAAVSARRIAALPLPRSGRGLLLGVRLLLLALLALAFIEPALVFERLPPLNRRVPVLIDASKSMRLYGGDSSAARLLAATARWNAGRGTGVFVPFLFGDSLRGCDLAGPSPCSDRRSFFPEADLEKKFGDAASILIVSDGNWSNAVNPAGALAEKNIWYLPLRNALPPPSLSMEPVRLPAESPVDSPLMAAVTLRGTARTAGRISLAVKERGRVLAVRSMPVSAGFFRQELAVPLTTSGAGVRCYRFEARLPADSVSCSRSALHFALPGTFTYGIKGSRPSLDRRFFLSALRRRADFAEAPAAGDAAVDLLVIFDKNGAAVARQGGIKPRGAALFIGCLPCSSAVVRTVPAARLFRPFSHAAWNPFDNADLSSLPPPAGFLTCGNGGARAPRLRTPVLDAVIPAAAPPAESDTVEAVFTGRLNSGGVSAGQPAPFFIACAVSGLWRWDFWPLAVASGEERPFDFSGRLIDLTKKVLVNGLADNLLLLPADELVESDSLAFAVTVPADFPLSDGLRFACTFEHGGVARLDTSFVWNPLPSAGAGQVLRFAPLPAGSYRLEARAAGGGRRYAFSDSVVVDIDRSEFAAAGQNLSLLQELGQPLTDCSPAGLGAAFFSAVPEKGARVRTVVHLNRSWPLLLAIFLVLAAEWIIRRALKLD